MKSRLEKVDWTFNENSKYDDYRNKETAYTSDELWNFDAELLPVIAKCTDEFRTTGNRFSAALNADGIGEAVNAFFSTAA